MTSEGRVFLEKVSGLKLKEDVDFILNPSDLRHMYNEHYGENEKDKGNNTPLTDDDIRKMVDVISEPERVIYGINKKTGNKVFIFLSSNSNGSYNLAEVYTDRRGNLTAKSFYNTKKTISQRVNELLTSSPRLTSATEGASSSLPTKIPKLFDIAKDNANNLEMSESIESAEADELYRDGDEVEDILSDGSMGFDERITAAAVKLSADNADDKALRDEAMRAIGGNLSKLRRAMSLQRAFDMTTVKRVADLAKILMEGGYLNRLSQGEVKRLLAAVKNSVGRNDIAASVSPCRNRISKRTLVNMPNII